MSAREGKFHLTILGGGITGLSAAFYAKKLFADKKIPLQITIVEKSERFGGKINTLYKDGFVIERGPDSFLARKMPIIHLSRELGLEDELVGVNPKAKKNYILHNNKLHQMPPGLVLGIPTQLTPFMKTGLVSIAGKARAAMDMVIPKREEDSDESLGHFLQRRLGKEVLEQIAEPLLAGIYAGDTYKLSLQATFPQFQAVEKKHGSLIKGMMLNKQAEQKQEGMPKAAENSVFLTYKNGLSTLVERLMEELHDVELVNGLAATSVVQGEHVYEITMDDGSVLATDSVIAALPGYGLAPLFPDVPEVKELGRMQYVSVANVILAFDEKEFGYELDGSGYVIPRKEGRYITACTWTSSKWLHTAPKGKVLIRCYVGRSGAEDWVNDSDEDIIRRVRKDLREIMGITAEPLFHQVTRLKRSMPQYPVGHLQKIKGIRQALAEKMPGVYITGAAFHGVGLPDCIRQGKEAVETLLADLTK